LLGEAWYQLKKFDSAIANLNKVMLPFNYNGIHNFTFGIMVKTKVAILLSKCYENLGQKQAAIDELLPLIFIDLTSTYPENQYSHQMILKRLKKLGFHKWSIDTTNLYLDTLDHFSNSVYGFRPFHPLVYLNFNGIKIYILPNAELIEAFNGCLINPVQVQKIDADEPPLFSESEPKTTYRLNKICMKELLLKSDFFNQ
jgi:tetratricopeptide (TPR) repeat protein